MDSAALFTSSQIYINEIPALPWLVVQEKAESAVKVAGDAAALLPQADGDTENASPGSGSGSGSGKDTLGVGADLDAYIKNLLNTPTLGEEGTLEQPQPTSPAGKCVVAYIEMCQGTTPNCNRTQQTAGFCIG